MINDTLRIAVPSKGRLAEPTITLLRAAGIPVPSDDRRLLVPIPDQNVELLFARTDDIPTLIRDGAADVGVAGSNQLLEYGSDDAQVRGDCVSAFLCVLPCAASGAGLRARGDRRRRTPFPHQHP